MRNLFKPEDFENLSVTKDDLVSVIAAEIANYKLEKLIEAAPVILKYSQGITCHWNTEDVLGKPDNPTHKARLICIEEIVKEPCKHEPKLALGITDANYNECKHCGVELVADWKPK